ncbi:MAG: carbohydrate ABC transporter permease [Omnitrophica WOR_2 bacterium]
MVHKNRWYRIPLAILGYLVLIIVALTMVIPFIWMITTSLRPFGSTFSYPPELIPKTFDTSNYTRLFTLVPFGRYFVNTIFITAATVLGQLFICAMAAYGFSRLKFWGRDTIFVLYLATMMIPFQIILIPLYLMVFRLGWVNTYQGLIVPSLSSAFGIFLLRQAFFNIPQDYQDAARIDGAGEFRIFLQIILPLAIPSLATLGVFAFMGAWTDLLWPVLIARDQQMRTLEVGLAYFNAGTVGAFRQPNWPLMMAASVVVMLPVLIVYFFTQRFFVEGISMTGVKG